MDNQSFSDSTVLITGAASGIGRATAVAFGERGGNLLLADIDNEGGSETARRVRKETAGDATFFETDVTDQADVEAMVEQAVDTYGGLDVAFNNAGLGGTGMATEEIPEADWDAVLDTNLSGVWRCLRAELPVMANDDGGAIINAASILGQVGEEQAPAYTAAKHGVVGLTKVAALENGEAGVRVNAVCPGYVETPMIEADIDGEEMRAGLESLHALDRLARPEEIAETVTWLASPAASFVTGEAIAVDGGYLSR